MIYYLLLLIIISITYLLTNYLIKNENKKTIFLSVAFIEMLLFLGLRDTSVGIDLKNYIPFFNLFKDSGWDIVLRIKLEKGYIIYNKLIGLVGGENLFLFITALVSLFGVYFSILKYSKNYFLSTFIFITMHFYIFLFSGLRQAIAYSIIWISLKYIKERKLLKFLTLVLIATTFHKTAIIFLPVYFLSNKKLTHKYLIIFLIVILMTFIFKLQIFNIITKLVYGNYAAIQNGGGYKLLLLLIIIFVGSLYILYKKNNKEEQEQNNIWLNMLLIGILVQTLASIEGNIARLTMYFEYSIIFLIPNIIEEIDDKKIRIFLKCIVYILLTVYFVISIQNSTSYIPYKMFMF